jgi:hypothetical protein
MKLSVCIFLNKNVFFFSKMKDRNVNQFLSGGVGTSGRGRMYGKVVGR